ncbi:hypothetical protein JW851_04185 [Candidatus Woesearchaeota archaeon]|nr:hypothetical protein [Candidatus Woesearchaeota archaeon]
MNWIEFKDRFNRFGWFTKKEIWGMFILVLCFAFVFSFDMRGDIIFDASVGFMNLLVCFVIVGIIVLIHHLVQRSVCIFFGFKPSHSVWWPGLILSLLVMFFSNGSLVFLMGSVFKIEMRDIQRVGWWRYGLNVKQQGIIAVSGNIVLILLAGLLKLSNVVPGSFLDKFIAFSVLFVLFNMIPWPHSDGCCMFLGSRLYFIFIAGAFIGFLVFLGAGFLTAIFLGLILGLISWIVFYWYFERG